MCGIIGYLGNEKSIQVVIEGLKNLEYRGYDSAGVAFFKNGNLDVKRCKGKIKDLISSFGSTDVSSHLAIGHTRWATHGKPSENNAHPHKSGPVVVVHNGIIENYLEVKSSLENDGFIFTSETDTEALCHLIEKYHRMFSLEDSVVRALNEIKGSYAIAVLSEKEPDRLVCARKDSPLVLGIGNGEYFVASDVPAFLNYCRNVIFMENDEYAVLSKDGVELKTLSGDQVYRDSSTIMWTPSMAEKGGFKHFMLKEIFEQPRAISDTVRGRYSLENGSINLAELGLEQIPLTKISKIFLVACGTSWHACTIGKYLIEELSGIPVEVDIASEFRYRNPLVKDGNLFIAVSQSGETADTLAALREARRLGARTMTICNVVGSSAAREAEAVFYTHSGPEIGVASTKAFLTQIAALYLLAIALGMSKKVLDSEKTKGLLQPLVELPGKIEMILSEEEKIAEIAKTFFKAENFLYLGRGILYPVALEGALKLKEISYIHAEGYPAGEMKHGPIALVDEEMPVVFITAKNLLFEKIVSNIHEIMSRGGRSIVITDTECAEISTISERCVNVPSTITYLLPIVMAVPLQLLAYHIAILRGCDVDQPRNLAKSVTVE